MAHPFLRVTLFAPFLLFSSAASGLSLDWITVGDAANGCDPQAQGCFGSVADVYRISKYEVTNSQYAEFLNAVAQTDTHALYNTSMSSGFGGITRSGSPGSYTYGVIAGRESMPVNYVSFYDALRFANWLHNGQSSGAQGSATTEAGAYDLALGGSVVRKAGASVFLTNEDEWYKAAYYDASSSSYFDYPAGSDVPISCSAPGPAPNSANCDFAVGTVTNIGSYTGSPSPAGTFDQGGNVLEWIEDAAGGGRVLRAGNWHNSQGNVEASNRDVGIPSFEDPAYGFRVASVPEPPVILMLSVGLLGFARMQRWS